MRELAPVRAERVRLDQVGAGVDEADMEGDDRVGRAEVRLLGAPQARHGGREQGAHAAVGDDDRALLEALQKTVPSLYFGGHIVSFQLARHIHPGFRPAGIGTLPLEAGCRGFTGPDPSASLDAERDVARYRDGV